MKEHYMPRRMARTVQHIQTKITDADAVALFQPSFRHERLALGKAILARLLR